MTELAAAVEAHLAPLRRAAAELEAELTAFADRVQAEADAVAHRSCPSLRVVWPRTQKHARRADLAAVLDAGTTADDDDLAPLTLRRTLDADHSPPPGQLARTSPAAAQAPPRPDRTRRCRGSVRFSPPPSTARRI